MASVTRGTCNCPPTGTFRSELKGRCEVRTNLLVLAVSVISAGCGSDSLTPLGEAISAIVSGNSQRVTADQVALNNDLPQAVVQQMVRTTAGIVSLATVNATDPVVLKGSPIVGAVVCAEGGNGRLTPFSRCTNTDAQGKATFVFETSTVAGEATAEIRGYLDGKPAVFDTAIATVLPGVPDSNAINDFIAPRASPATYLPTHVVDRFANPAAYRIPADARLTPQDTVMGSAGARTVTFDASTVDSVWRTVILTGDQDAAVVQLTYRLVFSTEGLGATGQNVPRIQAVFCGLKVSACKSTNWQ